VVASFPPLACFVRNVGGDRVGVISVCTVEGPHEHDFHPEEARALRKADLLLALGLGLDDKFTDRLHSNSGNARLAYVKLGERLQALDKGLVLPTWEAEEHKPAGRAEDQGERDPHVWLGIPQAKKMAELIGDELKKADAANAKDYDANARKFADKLQALQDEYKPKFDKKDNKRVVSFHDSMQYLARSFNLDVVGVIELHPNEEPSAGRTSELVKIWTDRKEGERPEVITVEPQYNEKVVDALIKELEARKITVKKVTVDPLETASAEELKDPGWYLKKMRANLDALLEGLPDT
jgi:ABC-type Zn uptake system ZnuABC Zn-binding protein ZnuA